MTPEDEVERSGALGPTTKWRRAAIEPLSQWLMDNDYRIRCEELLREERFYYETIVAECDGPVRFTQEQLYFGSLQMQALSPAFLSKWQHIQRHKQQPLTNVGQARHAIAEDKVQETARQARWISELLIQGLPAAASR